MALQLQGKRKSKANGHGLWKREAVGIRDSTNTAPRWRDVMFQAGVVLDETPDTAPAVLSGLIALDAAYRFRAFAAGSAAIRDLGVGTTAYMGAVRDEFGLPPIRLMGD